MLAFGAPAMAGPPVGSVARPTAPQRLAVKAPQPLAAEEREELVARAEEPGPEVRGGALSNQNLTYIVIALAAMVLVLIAK